MHFVNYLPFGLLILVPGIILLYILKQKSEDKDISSLYLWRETYKNIEVSKPWEKLKNNLLMYLQIAVVLGLILALAGPYIASREGAADHVVLVFDNSGSMNALYAKGKSRLDTAKEQAVDYVEQLSTNADVTILSSNQTAKVVVDTVYVNAYKLGKSHSAVQKQSDDGKIPLHGGGCRIVADGLEKEHGLF